MVALDAIGQQFHALPHKDRKADNQTMLTFLKSRPEIADAGISEDSCIWGRFKDGRELLIVNNRNPNAHSRKASLLKNHSHTTRALRNGLPGSKKAVLLNGLGTCYVNVTEELSAMLTDKGYDVSIGEASVDRFLHLRDDFPGVLFVSSHGGTAQGTEPYALWTTTEVNKTNDAALATYLAEGSLRYMFAEQDERPDGECEDAKHYGVTTKFVQKYITCSANSLVYLDACTSAGAGGVMRSAWLRQGASLFVGWTRSVDSDFSVEASQFVFDRMLGTNSFLPETDAKPPLDYQAVKTEMSTHTPRLDLYTEADNNVTVAVELVFIPNDPQFTNSTAPVGDLGLLAPSIQNLYPNRTDNNLKLIGQFGQNPSAEGQVTVDGTPLTVRSWEFNQIVCDLPASGPGSSGTVKVSVRGHTSNGVSLPASELLISPAQVTLKRGQSQKFTATRTEVQWSATGGSIDQNGNYTAGNTPGQYNVTVSVNDGATSATAAVTIIADCYTPNLANGQPFFGTATWTRSDGTIQTINTSLGVTSLGGGKYYAFFDKFNGSNGFQCSGSDTAVSGSNPGGATMQLTMQVPGCTVSGHVSTGNESYDFSGFKDY